MRGFTWVYAVVAVGAAAGCSERVVEQDSGIECFSWADGEPTVVRVNYGCVPCGASQVSVTCSATFDGDHTIEVSSSAAYTKRPQVICNEMCAPMMATCELEPLAAGTYTVVHGLFEGEVELGPLDTASQARASDQALTVATFPDEDCVQPHTVL